jgi:hypothetical protein
LVLQIRYLLLGVCDLLLALSNLPFSVCDLLFALGNLPFSFGYLAVELFILSQQPIILPAQLFTTGLVRVPIALPLSPFPFCAARRSRIHPGLN